MQPFFGELLEDAAEELGVIPSFWKLFRQSPMFALKAQFGPVVPALYRITGHGAVPDGMENYKKICYRAYNTPNYKQQPSHTEKHNFHSFITRLLALAVVAFAVFLKIIGSSYFL